MHVVVDCLFVWLFINYIALPTSGIFTNSNLTVTQKGQLMHQIIVLTLTDMLYKLTKSFLLVLSMDLN